MNVQTVAEEVKEEMEKFSNEKIKEILSGYGVSVEPPSREEMIKQIVDFEVYAFTH